VPVEYRTTTLANGLTLGAEVDPRAQSVGVGFFVRAGARDEDPRLMGVSHFLEHMMFKGCEGLDAEGLNRAFDEMGASNNAYTTREMTCFYAHVVPECAGRAIDLLGRMMRPSLLDEDFETERGVILEEIAMYADNPFFELYERTLEARYAEHPLGHRVLGTRGSVGSMTRDAMRAYFEGRYSADNTMVALAGALDFDEAVAAIERRCAAWPRSNPKRRTPVAETRAESFLDTSERVNRAYTLRVSDAPPIGSEGRYAAALLAQILGGEDNSRLHWALIETGLADEAVASYDGLDGAGDLLVYASGDPDRIDEIDAAIDAEITALRDTLAERDLAKLRARMLTSVTLASERPAGRMQRLGRTWAATGSYLSLEEELDRINAVDVDSVRAVLDAHPPDRAMRGRVVPAPLR